MIARRSNARSSYLEFAKLHTGTKYNLATSGIANYPIAGLPVRLEELEINGPNAYGYAPLQERLARKNAVAPECVVAAIGTSMANHLAMAACFDPGDEVLIEDPTYQLLVSTAEFLGAEVRRFPRRFEDEFRVDPQEVERAVTPRTRLIVLCNLHNPSSAKIEDDTLRDIGEIAARAGARVLVDEVYAETLWWEQPARSAFHLGEHFVVTSSLTKAYGLSGLRCGWVLAEPRLSERIWHLGDLFAGTPAHPAELLSVIALDNLARIAERARGLLDANRRVVQSFLDTRRELVAFCPGLGTTIFPRLLEGSVDEFGELLRQKYDTSVVPGRFFGMPQHFRIGLGGDPTMTAQGLDRLATALDDYTRSH